jgi:hypothetical protein
MTEPVHERTRPLADAITAVLAALENVANAPEAAEPGVAPSLERVRATTSLLSRLLVETPETLITGGLITTLVQQLQPVPAALSQLAADPATTASSLDTAAENVLAALGMWPPTPRLDDDTGGDIAQAIEKRVERASSRIEKRAGEVTSLVAEAEEKLGEQRQAVDQAVVAATASIGAKASEAATALAATKAQADALLPSLQQQFAQAEAARAEKFETTTTGQIEQLKAAANADLNAIKAEVTSLRGSVGTEKTRLDTLATNQQQQFTTAQEQRSKDFAGQRDQIAAVATTQRNEETARADAHFAEMERILEETQRVANAVANTGTASAYGKDAVGERRSANFWRWAGIAFAVAAAIFAGITLIWKAPDPTGINYIGTGGRLGVTLALGAIATYATKQSAQHRRREERSRQIELELTAFGPFIEGLDDDTKRQLRARYVLRLFRGYDATTAAGTADEGLRGEASVNVAGQFVDTISSAVRKQ